MKLKYRIKLSLRAIFWGFLITALIVTSIPQSVLADGDITLDSETSLNFYLNNIYYYDPEGGLGNICSPGGGTTDNSVPNGGGGRYEKLKNVVRQYGEYAMQLQKQYVSPWEVIFAQMQMESQTGEDTNPKAVSFNVAKLGYYNWLGITSPRGNVGDTEPYIDAKGRSWAMFTSVESMMNAWAGPHLLRNGRYNEAFKYTDPDNYSLDNFINTMVPIYAPPEDNNDTVRYIELIKTFINGPITEVRQEMGWPTSAEYAKQENIPIGGAVGLDGEITSDSPTLAAVCGPEAGNLTSYVLAYAWPEYHAPNFLDMMPDYKEAVDRRLQQGKYVGGGSHPGIDCGGFVTTLLQDSGFDPEYGGGGSVPTQHSYVKEQGWEIINDISQLQPGDVAFNADNSHTFVYVGNINGFGSVIASASYSGRTNTNWRAPMAGKENMNNVTWYHKR